MRERLREGEREGGDQRSEIRGQKEEDDTVLKKSGTGFMLYRFV